MRIKCEECSEHFKPSRRSQRFCSTRCANRKRDRRRRHRAKVANITPGPEVRNKVVNRAPNLLSHQGTAEARLTTALATARGSQGSLLAQLRSQSADVDYLAAETAEQRTVIKILRIDVARLQSAQRTDAQDLVHLAGDLLALSRATQIELHNSTKEIFRRRGWTVAARSHDGRMK